MSVAAGLFSIINDQQHHQQASNQKNVSNFSKSPHKKGKKNEKLPADFPIKEMTSY